jgi:2-methylcitrate dehydratase
MTDAEVEKKFRSLVEPRYGKAKADKVLALCWDMERLKSPAHLVQVLS